MATTTIYLSSTYEDLKDYRRVVFEALRKSGYDVIAMEDYVATDQRPVDKCLKDVERANLYVGLFAFRYGYLPPSHHNNPDNLSITELEFRHALALKKPCLTFVVDEHTSWPRLFDDARTSADKGERITALRQYLLTEKLASPFSQPHELAALVLAAVANHLANKPESLGAKEPAPSAVTWDIEKQGSPYPGLLHFTRKYAPVFFGRDAEVREILDRMRLPEGRFIIVSGDSGAGKSSVIDAGVLPRIEQSGLTDSTQALCLRLLPSQGHDPFSALMGVLNPFATQAGLKPDVVANELIQSPDRLSRYVRKILSEGTDRHALVLFLDQMEELFTTHSPAESRKFLQALYQAAEDGHLWVLATIRSDHLHHCHAHPEMLRVLRGPGHYPLGPIEPFLLSDLIAKPARCAGLSISDHLVRRLVHETLTKVDDAATPDQSNLPLLAFVLDELFKGRSNHELSEDVYKQMKGVAGAIAQHAAQVEADLDRTQGAKANVLLTKLFESLVIMNTEGLPTRRHPLRREVRQEMNELVNVLVGARLLRTEGEGPRATVSISHERLFEAWPSLKDYVTKNKKQLMDRTLLERRARKWVETDRPWFDGLASGREYRDFCRTGVTLTQEMKEYLRASRRARWLQMGVIGMVIVSLGGIGTWLWKEGQQGLTVEQAILRVASKMTSIHVVPDMQPVAGGTFRQGDTHGRGSAGEKPVHEVTIKPFAIGKFEVTFDEYDRFALATERLPLPHDQGWGRGRRPVINVSWDDAKAYAKWLSQATGKSYRLPTESEWEYAARSIAKNNDDIWAGTSKEEELDQYAVFRADRTALVGEKTPNRIGLYHMSGNAFEWVEDCWYDNYTGAPTDGSSWGEADGSFLPLGEAPPSRFEGRTAQSGGECGQRVIRGGSWSDFPVYMRASYRHWNYADSRYNTGIGFRLAQDTP